MEDDVLVASENEVRKDWGEIRIITCKERGSMGVFFGWDTRQGSENLGLGFG